MVKFVSAENTNFWAPVVAKIPNGEGGFEEHWFQAQFRYVDFGAEEPTNSEFLEKTLINLKDLNGEDGQPMMVTPENTEALAKSPFFIPGFVAAYFNTIAGLEHPEKN